MNSRIEFFDILFFFILFIIGIYISKDFGISWDESHHRHSGQKILAYLVKFFGMDWIKPIPKGLSDFNYIEKMYGPIFDTTSAAIEQIFQINDMKDVFTMRRYLNFIFYFTGYLGYFYLIKILFPKSNYTILLSFFYLFHPRLFAQGFFNPKDSILQVYISISLIPIIRSFLYFKFKDLFFSSIAIGIAISTKVVAVYIPLLFSIFYLLIGYFENISIKSVMKNLSLFYLSLLFFIFIFWPPWTNPVKSIIDIFLVLKKYPFPGENFIMGEYISRFNLPWYYVPLWIGITTPLTFIILFFIGLWKNFRLLFKKTTKSIYIDSFMLTGFLIPLFSVIFFGSTLYGGWRHMFFIYPFLVYFMINGFINTSDWMALHSNLNRKNIILFLGIIVFSAPIFSIIKTHPNQSVYFNLLAGKDPMLLFEGDAWGTSYRQGLEWIVENDKRDSIMVSIHNSPGSRNRHMIPINDRKRLHFQFISSPSTIEKIPGDYFMTNFYGEQPNLYMKAKNNISPLDKETFSVNTGEMKILGLYDLSN
tara:strand:+ start:1038 stop:2636 length:1599 start_codon:yes stop_codon:yes gene_type:complete